MDASKKSKKAGGKEKQPLPPSFLLFSAVLLDFSLTVKAAPHECVIRTSQP